MDIIRLENISLLYEGKYYLKNFSYNFLENNKYVIVGKSGSGKSSILSVILGFIEFEGKVIYQNKYINDFNKIREVSAYLPQYYTLMFDSISELFSFYKDFISKHLSMEKFKDTLKQLDLDENYINKKFREMSGGEIQRVLFSFIFALQNKKLFFLDEPTSALDEALENKVIELIQNREATFFIVSHSHNLQKNFYTLNSEEFVKG